MRTFLLELLYADGSRKIESVGARWHDAYLSAVKPKKNGKKPILVCVWSSSKGIIKKAILNRVAYAKFLKVPTLEETLAEVEEAGEEVEGDGDGDGVETPEAPENLDDSE